MGLSHMKFFFTDNRLLGAQGKWGGESLVLLKFKNDFPKILQFNVDETGALNEKIISQMCH